MTDSKLVTIESLSISLHNVSLFGYGNVAKIQITIYDKQFKNI
jgi:hypothetical protein